MKANEQIKQKNEKEQINWIDNRENFSIYLLSFHEGLMI